MLEGFSSFYILVCPYTFKLCLKIPLTIRNNLDNIITLWLLGQNRYVYLKCLDFPFLAISSFKTMIGYSVKGVAKQQLYFFYHSTSNLWVDLWVTCICFTSLLILEVVILVDGKTFEITKISYLTSTFSLYDRISSKVIVYVML